MNDQRSAHRLLISILAAGSIFLLPGCPGGGGGASDGGTMAPGLQANFVGQSPTAGSLSMQQSSVNGPLFQVAIAVTDVADFFSARFRVEFDPAVAIYTGFDPSTSFLHGQDVNTSFRATETQSGSVLVEAGRVFVEPLSFNAPAPSANSISIQPGTISGTQFELLITATDVPDLFGAAFRVSFDAGVASFLSFDASTSLLEDSGIMTRYDVFAVQPGELTVAATRLQNATATVEGVDVAGSQTLIALTFDAVGFTGGSSFALDPPREACGPEPDCANLLPVSWTGGTLVNGAPVTGVDVTGTRELILLDFEATAPTDGSPWVFTPIEVCDDSQLPSCNPIAVTYLDGTLFAN